MSWVKQNTKKILTVLFLSTLVFQGSLISIETVWADTWGSEDPGTGIPTRGPVNTVINTQEKAVVPAAPMPGTETKEGSILGGIIDGMKAVVIWILIQIRTVIFLVIMTPAAGMFSWVVDPANISGPTGILNLPAIYVLWQFIRDFFNLFFIFILLFSAFATIFQVDSFNIRNIFKNVLLVALLINFSFPITRFLIDAANVPMYYFINDVIGNGTGRGGLIAMEKLLANSGASVGALANTGANEDLMQVIMTLMFAFLFGISLLVLAVMMVIRLIALTLLLIFSPIGFATSLLPGMNKFGQEWWSKFWSYALFGPAAGLMLVVSIKFLEAISSGDTWQSMLLAATNVTANETQMTTVVQVVFFSIPIILIWTVIGMANKFSMAGAATVTGAGYGVANWTRKKMVGAAVGTARWGGRKVESKMASNKYTKWASPTVLMTALKARSEERKHKDERPVKQAAAQVQDTLNKAVSKVFRNPLKWGKATGVDHTDHDFAEVTRQSGEQMKEMENVSTDGAYIIQELKIALNNQDKSKTDAALQILAKNNDMNDMLTSVGADEKYGLEKDPVTKEVIVSSANMLKLLPQLLVQSGEKNADILAKKVMNIGERATGAGNYAFGGMTKFDPDMDNGHGGFRLASAQEQGEWAGAKVKNLESQKRQTSIHPDSLFTRTENGGFGDINGEVAQQIIGTFTQGDVGQVNRSRDDMKAAISNAHKNIDETVVNDKGEKIYKYAGFRDAYNNKNGDTAIFKDYVDAINLGMKTKAEQESLKKEEKTPEQRKAAAVVQPGETISGGGVIIPQNAGSGPRKNP